MINPHSLYTHQHQIFYGFRIIIKLKLKTHKYLKFIKISKTKFILNFKYFKLHILGFLYILILKILIKIQKINSSVRCKPWLVCRWLHWSVLRLISWGWLVNIIIIIDCWIWSFASNPTCKIRSWSFSHIIFILFS